MLVRFCEISKKMVWIRHSEYGNQAISLAETTYTFPSTAFILSFDPTVTCHSSCLNCCNVLSCKHVNTYISQTKLTTHPGLNCTENIIWPDKAAQWLVKRVRQKSRFNAIDI